MDTITPVTIAAISSGTRGDSGALPTGGIGGAIIARTHRRCTATGSVGTTGRQDQLAFTVTDVGTAGSKVTHLNCSRIPANIRVTNGNALEFTGSNMAKPRGPDEQPTDEATKGGNEKTNDPDQPFASLDEFFEDVEKRAYRMAVYTLKDEQTALDAVQDAMLKLVEKYSQRPPSEWAALFFTILNNRMIDIQRWGRLREAGGKLKSLFRYHDSGEEDLLDTGLGSDQFMAERPEVASWSRDLHNKIDNALTKLSDRQRQVFLLREWQGFNVRETSEILGCSEGSVKQHHFRAMQALRKHLAGVWEHEQ